MKITQRLWIIILLVALTQSHSALSAYAQDPLHQSIKEINSETKEQESLKNEQAETQAKYDESTGKLLRTNLINRAEDTAQQEALVGSMNHFNPQSIQDFVSDTVQSGKDRAKYIDMLYKQNAEAARVQARQRQLGLEQSAESLEEQLADPSAGPQDAQLQPLGTNLYVRNYSVTPSAPIIELVGTQKALHVFSKQGPPYVNSSVHGKILDFPASTTSH